MTFGEFKKENNWFSNYLIDLWKNKKAPLFPLMDLYEKKGFELTKVQKQLKLIN